MCNGDWASVARAGTSPTHWGLQTSWCRTPDDTRRVLLTLCCRVRTVQAAQEWTAHIRQVVLMSWLISFSVSVVWRECKPSLYSAWSSVRCISGYLRKYKLIYLQYSKLDIFSGVCWNERLLFLSFNYLVSRRTGRQQHSALLFSPVLNICC